jgi:predicted NBD/HSP70 family sugar kinase
MTGAAMVTEEFPGSEGDFGACCGSTGIERAAAQHGLAGLAAPQIIKLWKQDHPQAAQAITDLADYFATGAADLADSLIAERIAVGGGLAVDLGEAFLELVRPRLSSHLNFECELVSAHWGARAGVVGAALLATEGTGPSGRNEEVLPPTLASGLAEVQSSTDEASEWGEERHLQAVYGMKTRL